MASEAFTNLAFIREPDNGTMVGGHSSAILLATDSSSTPLKLPLPAGETAAIVSHTLTGASNRRQPRKLAVRPRAQSLRHANAQSRRDEPSDRHRSMSGCATASGMHLQPHLD